MVFFQDAALICLNGHAINTAFRKCPTLNKRFCDKCGAKTIWKCPSCDKEIEGSLQCDEEAGNDPFFPVPAYCQYCGNPFPWTESRIKAAKELVFELEDLTDEEKRTLGSSFNDIARETPGTDLAATKIKKIMTTAKKETATIIMKVVTSIASEAAKKILWG